MRAFLHIYRTTPRSPHSCNGSVVYHLFGICPIYYVPIIQRASLKERFMRCDRGVLRCRKSLENNVSQRAPTATQLLLFLLWSMIGSARRKIFFITCKYFATFASPTFSNRFVPAAGSARALMRFDLTLIPLSSLPPHVFTNFRARHSRKIELF